MAKKSGLFPEQLGIDSMDVIRGAGVRRRRLSREEEQQYLRQEKPRPRYTHGFANALPAGYVYSDEAAQTN